MFRPLVNVSVGVAAKEGAHLRGLHLEPRMFLTFQTKN